MEKAQLVDKSWIDVGKVFEKITPRPGFFKYRQTEEMLYEAEGSLKNAFELSAELKQNEDDRVIIQALIEENKWNQLFFKLISRRTEVVRNFLKVLADNVNVHAVGKDQETSLHLAAQNKKLDLIEILVRRGAEINAMNSSSNTPLMIAAKWSFYKMEHYKSSFTKWSRSKSERRGWENFPSFCCRPRQQRYRHDSFGLRC